VIAIAIFILITNVGMALFRSPTVAWLGDLFRPDQRSQANGIINLMGGIGAMLAFFVGGQLFDSLGRNAPFIFGAAVLAIATLTAVLYVREPERIETGESDEKPAGVLGNLRALLQSPERSAIAVLSALLFWSMGYAALEFGLSSFAVSKIGLTTGTAAIFSGSISVAFILFAIPAGIAGNRIGRGRAIRIGLIGLALSTLAGYIFIENVISFVLVLVACGIFWAMVNVNALPLVFDHGDERRIGAFTGMYYFSSQLAAILGPTLGGQVVERLGNDYSWLWLFTSIFMGLAAIVMLRVKSREIPVVN
jgi:MFS family permease